MIVEKYRRTLEELFVLRTPLRLSRHPGLSVPATLLPLLPLAVSGSEREWILIRYAAEEKFHISVLLPARSSSQEGKDNWLPKSLWNASN